MGERVVVGLGANLGDAAATLQTAVDAIGETPGVAVVAVSPVYRTAPVGGPEQPDYLNAASLLDVELEPLELLRALQAIEHDQGRVRDVRWGPRTLDLDVLLWVGRTLDLPDLIVPHPRLVKRRFALEPLLDVLPDALLPDGRHLGTVVRALPEQGISRLRSTTIAGTRPADRG
jgi:2-amino-4-hydroxy-6-hydroxymethyldihydropteridine diphosphokinase